jgi:PAS domain S-box-containing protein
MTWNTGAQRIFGYADGEIIGRDAAVLFTPEDRARGEHEKELATAVAEGKASDDRWQMRKGGERFFASGVTTPLRDAGGTLRGFVKIARDLTERQQILEQRERLLEQEKVARLEAERAMTIRDEFLAVVSHELRTPLTAILLWSKMLGGGGGAVKPEDQTHVFDMIRQSAEAQRQLIEDLLDVSRMISGKMRLRVTEAELAPLVRAAVDATRPMAEAKDVRLELSLGGDAGRARVDPDRIQQVVWNLLNNAVKFTDAGGRVRVGLGRAGSTVRVEVADTGRGISAEFLPHVFDRFRQADASLTRTEGGLGLGLAIARQLVELHGGTIRARSPGLGKGSTFTVELPAGDGRVEAGGERRAGGGGLGSGVGGVIGVGGAFAASPVLAGLRVLVVEDEANTRTVIRWLLEQCAADVTAVESAALAVAAFREGLARGRFDVIVSDVGMPVQDGYELLREIREMERQRGGPVATPALALTAYARDEDRARAEAAGFQAHLAKPVEPKALVEAVARLAGR